MPQHEVFIDLNHYRLMHGPIMVSFDITQRCNLRCVHCFNNSGDQAPNACAAASVCAAPSCLRSWTFSNRMLPS